LTWW